MAVAQGYGKTVTSGSVFAYDVADTRNSYIGEPTTNVLYSYDPFLVSEITWTNSGEWTVNNNETDIEKPTIPGINTNSLRILSGRTITVGSQHIGCAFSGTTLSPSTTYTISIWFRQNRAGSNQPYFRTNVNNNSMGNFNYNGNTDASTWPVNQWIKISATATLQANENGIYLSNYIGSQVGDKVWYFAAQIEAKNHATSLALGTRSVTQGLLPLVGNSTLDLSNMSFDSNAQIVFDGTDDYINTTKTASNLGIYDAPYTMEAVFKVTNTISGDNMVFGTDQTAYRQGMHNGLRNGNIYFAHYSADYAAGSVALNEMVHVLWVYDGTTAFIYKNGVLQGSSNIASFIGTTNIQVGRSWAYFQGGEIPVAKIYNRALSAGEVRQNYLHYKTRFNLG
jgi:hypothetical protein